MKTHVDVADLLCVHGVDDVVRIGFVVVVDHDNTWTPNTDFRPFEISVRTHRAPVKTETLSAAFGVLFEEPERSIFTFCTL